MNKEDLEKKIMDDYSGTFIKETIGKFAVEAFKASLREEIESRKQYWSQAGGQEVGMRMAYDDVLKILDTVKPKTE